MFEVLRWLRFACSTPNAVVTNPLIGQEIGKQPIKYRSHMTAVTQSQLTEKCFKVVSQS